MNNIDKINGLVLMLNILREDPRTINNGFVSDILDEMIQTSNYGSKKYRLKAIQECLSTNSLEDLYNTESVNIMGILAPIEDLPNLEELNTSSIDTASFNKFCRDNSIKLTKKDMKLFIED